MLDCSIQYRSSTHHTRAFSTLFVAGQQAPSANATTELYDGAKCSAVFEISSLRPSRVDGRGWGASVCVRESARGSARVTLITERETAIPDRSQLEPLDRREAISAVCLLAPQSAVAQEPKSNLCCRAANLHSRSKNQAFGLAVRVGGSLRAYLWIVFESDPAWISLDSSHVRAEHSHAAEVSIGISRGCGGFFLCGERGSAGAVLQGCRSTHKENGGITLLAIPGL